MTKTILRLSFLIALLSTLIMFTGCSKDEDDAPLESYIIGRWHSYKATVFLNGEKHEMEITKTGLLSLAYCEVNFKNGKNCDMSVYVEDSNHISHWETDHCTYSISSNVITITDSKGETGQLFYDPNEKVIYLRSALHNTNGYTTTFIYFRK